MNRFAVPSGLTNGHERRGCAGDPSAGPEEGLPHIYLGLPDLVRPADMVDGTDQDIGPMRW